MLKLVTVIGTGGTISGVSDDPASCTRYSAAVLSCSALLSALPRLPSGTEAVPDDFMHIESSVMTFSEWAALASRASTALASSDGIVITHGTDTLEETAYFLSLVLDTSKPVLVTGAMRPFTAVGSDGVRNLYDSVCAAASPACSGLGVLVCMNGVLVNAREAVKMNPVRCDSFVPRERGYVGTVIDGETFISSMSTKKHTHGSLFAGIRYSSVPDVPILYSYAGAGGELFDFYASRGVRGLVLDCVGNGNLNPAWRAGAGRLAASGVEIVRCSRANGFVNRNGARSDDALHTLSGGDLSAQKARILLSLALSKGLSHTEIQKVFDEY